MPLIDTMHIFLLVHRYGLMSESTIGKSRSHWPTSLNLLDISLRIWLRQVCMAKNIQVGWFLEILTDLTSTGRHFVLLGSEIFACFATVAIVSLVECVVE